MLPRQDDLADFRAKPFHEREYPARERYVEINGIRVCYVDEGTGPTLLILPGLSLGAHNWRFNLKNYWKDYRVVLMDFPGYGKSEAPDVDYSIDFFKEIALGFMDKIGIEHAIILGHSLGGQVALPLAAEHPGRVDALILETATGVRKRYGLPEDIAINIYVTAERFANLPEDKLREYTEVNFYSPVPAQEELINYQLSFRAHHGHSKRFRERNEAFVRGTHHIIRTTVRKYAHRVQAPTLILWGRNDNLGRVENAYWLYSNIPDARLCVIERCGHQPHLEKPEVYDHAVLRFLEELHG